MADFLITLKYCRFFELPLILEGGAIHVDGEGTLLATKECVHGRNPELSTSQIEDILMRYLGVTNFVWLKRGLYFEENNGHIDNMCCFADSKTILLNWCDNKDDPQYEISSEAFEILSKAKNMRGESYTIVKVSQPPALYITDGESSEIDPSEYAIPRLPNNRLPASYVNAYICNGAVLMPAFACAYDRTPEKYDLLAYDVFRAAFKGRKIIQIPSRELLLGGGGIHCVLQQIPM